MSLRHIARKPPPALVRSISLPPESREHGTAEHEDQEVDRSRVEGCEGRKDGTYRDAEFSFKGEAGGMPLVLFNAASHGVVFDVLSVESLISGGECGARR